MKTFLSLLTCIPLGLAIVFIYPHLGESWMMVDDTGCLVCHEVGNLGANDGSIHGEHNDCASCHGGGIGQEGNVASATCSNCHPSVGPGLCPLVNFHDPDMGADCLVCHSECGEEPTTSTTTSAPSSTISLSPDTISRSRWIMLPALVAIRGNGTNFAQASSKPAYTPENALIKLPPLVLNAELIWQTILVNPAWLAGAGNQIATVTVDGASDDFEIKLLPLILDE